MAITGTYEADERRYRLKVGGVADKSLSLKVKDLRADFPEARELITVSCVGNRPGGGLLSASLFRGVRVNDIIDAARVPKAASGAIITGLDGFVAVQSMEELRRSESIIAYDMGIDEEDLAPLPIDNGFPTRIITPGLYGYMMPKWIDAITFVDQGGHHEVLRRSVDYFEGKMQLSSGFSSPRDGAELIAGPGEILGYTFGDGRSIAKVDVRVDDGPWEPAEIVYNTLSDEKPSYLWSLWRFEWDATPGKHRLSSRATYEDGESQNPGRTFPYSGGSIYTMRVTVTEAP